MQVFMIYPERRMVSDDQVIGWAKDSLVNAALKAAPADDDSVIAQVQATPEYRGMGIREAMELLEDEGSVTFGRQPVKPLARVGGLDCIF